MSERELTFADIGEAKTEAEEQRLWNAFVKQLAKTDDFAAREHLAAGRPIHYHAEDLGGRLVREWPDGRREFIDVAEDGTISVIAPV